MTARFIVTGTDTGIGIGKTVFSAGLAGLLDGFYWAGAIGPRRGNRQRGRCPAFWPAFRARPAGSLPSEDASVAASVGEIDGIAIEAAKLSLPELPGPLIIEGAGGLMVPLNRQMKFIYILRDWQLPVILCARTALGTINPTLLSLEALRARSIPLLGIAFIGDEMGDTQRTIAEMSRVRVLGRLPRLDPLTPALSENMRTTFNVADFTEAPQ